MLFIINRFIKFLFLLVFISFSLSAGGQSAGVMPGLPKAVNLHEYLAQEAGLKLRVRADKNSLESEESSGRVLMLAMAVAWHMLSFSVPKPADLADYLSRVWPRENPDVGRADVANYAHQTPRGDGRKASSGSWRSSAGGNGAGSSAGGGGSGWGMGGPGGGGQGYGGGGDDGGDDDEWRDREDRGDAGEKAKILKRSSTGKWTDGEDAELARIVEANDGRNWKKIAEELNEAMGRTGSQERSDAQCLHRWNKVLIPGLLKGPWSAAEDAIVRAAVEAHQREHGADSLPRWTHIAKLIPGRIGKQVRERWFNHLDPSVRKGGFSEEEDAQFLRLLLEYGTRWTRVAAEMPGRTELACRNRWNNPGFRRKLSVGQCAAIRLKTVEIRAKEKAERAEERAKAPAAAAKRKRRPPSAKRRGVTGSAGGAPALPPSGNRGSPPAAWAPGTGPGMPRSSIATQTGGLGDSSATQIASVLVQNPHLLGAALPLGVSCPAGPQCPFGGGEGDLGLTTSQEVAAVKDLLSALPAPPGFGADLGEESESDADDSEGSGDGRLPPDGKRPRVEDSGAGSGAGGQ